MKTNTTTTITTINGETMSNKQYKLACFDAYCRFVEYATFKIDAKTCIEKMREFMGKFGFDMNEKTLLTLVYAMMRNGTVTKEDNTKEKVYKIMSSTFFFKLVKEGYDNINRTIKNEDLEKKREALEKEASKSKAVAEAVDKAVKEALAIQKAQYDALIADLRKAA